MGPLGQQKGSTVGQSTAEEFGENASRGGSRMLTGPLSRGLYIVESEICVLLTAMKRGIYHVINFCTFEMLQGVFVCQNINLISYDVCRGQKGREK